MPHTSEQRDNVVRELKRIGASLNLSDDQKQKLQTFMTEASEKIQEYRQQNPNATREDLIKKVTDNRAALRQCLVNFLTPDQLKKWDSEIANAKEFPGQNLPPRLPVHRPSIPASFPMAGIFVCGFTEYRSKVPHSEGHLSDSYESEPAV